ncbi:hypothetical protein TcBrA4_0138880 [Trypanosoma cruzi]|nr:hypothetical protein TcBrA4_0138880 [Trypanosoma cruzi]
MIFGKNTNLGGHENDSGWIILLIFKFTESGWFKEMALVTYTTSEWGDIGARLSELVRQHGAIQVQLTFIDENGTSEASLTVATSMAGLRLISGSTTKT